MSDQSVNFKYRYGTNSNINYEDSATSLKNEINNKKLQYYTQNFFSDPLKNVGVNFNDGFGIPLNNIGVDSSLRSGSITNPNLSHQIGALPTLTSPGLYGGQGDVVIEQRMRSLDTRVRKECQPTDTKAYERYFSLFDGMPIKPMENVNNYVESGMLTRGGISTRKTLNYGKK